tara:strand:+ start:57654 stop:58925 length:1272 start_codon:yes stop_codon:yes gene_type:complete
MVAIFAFALMKPATRGYRGWEKRLISYALLAHFAGALALLAVYLYYYGNGDLVRYHRLGGIIAAHLSTDFGNVAPEVLALLLGTGGEGLATHGAGTSTGSMEAVAAILSFLLGDSILASSILIASGAFFGKLSIYSVLRRELSVEFHRPALIGALLVPSAVFWSGSLLKESVVMSFLGALVWGGYMLSTGRKRTIGAIALTVGVIGCALFKGYLLVPAAVAGMVWLYVRRSNKSKNVAAKPIYVLGATAAAFGLLLLIGNFNPRYDVFRAEQQLVHEAETMGGSDGGSNYTLLDTSGPTSTARLLLTAPWAVFTALLRPAIIEARNPLSLVNGLETLVLTIMLIRVIRRRGFWASVSVIRKSPILAFCAVFTLLLAIGVGFATTNMGTLSRYRMPLVPFFAVLLGVLGTTKQQRSPVPSTKKK